MKVLSVLPSDISQPVEVPGSSRKYSELFYLIPFFVGVIGIKLALALFVWRNGFLEYDADGFTRSVRAWDWHTGHTNLEVDAWLPLQFWLNGWLMGIWPDLVHVPRFVNMACSVGTTINLFFIGRQLFGRVNGYATALLAAVFPWEILFGLSGMSESLTHFFLTFGTVFFLKWLKGRPSTSSTLVIASLGFLGATMVRYEAWFYSTVYAILVLYFIWQYRANLDVKTRLKLVLALVPAFIFIGVWAGRSWAELGSPLGFADVTSGVNHKIFGATNETTSFWSRLVFYPKTFLTLLYQLTIPAVIGSILIIWRPVKNAQPYLLLVWGEFVLFILTTLPYNNIAPGSARYPVSNLLLLLPVVCYGFELVARQPNLNLRWLVGGVFLVLFLSLIQNTTSRSNAFPDGSTRQVAELLNQRWKEGYIKPTDKVYLLLPLADGPKADDFTRADYALKVLTNHPDSFQIESDPTLFTQKLKQQNADLPAIWVHLASAGGSPANLRTSYLEAKTFGDYTIGDYPLYGRATAQPLQGDPSPKFEVRSEAYRPKEATSVWVTRPDNKIITLGNRPADVQGIVSFNYVVTAQDYLPGKWSVAITGMETGRRTSATFEVPVAPAQP